MENVVRNPRRGFLALAAVVIIAVGIWVLATLTDSERPIRVAANAYLSALEDGDAEAALALLEPLNEDMMCPDLVTNGVYGQVDARPSGAQITSVELLQRGETGEGGTTISVPTALVDVTYQTASNGEDALVTLVLTKPDDAWLVDPDEDLGLIPLDLDLTGPGSIALDGACGASGTAVEQIRVLPGTYELSYTDPFNVGTFDSRMLNLPGTSGLRITPEATPEVTEAVTAQLNAWIDECIASGVTADVCPPLAKDGVTYIEVTSGDPAENLDVFVQPVEPTDVDAGGWTYLNEGYASVSVQATIREDACTPRSLGCIPGATTTDVIFFHYSGRVVADVQGNVTLD